MEASRKLCAAGARAFKQFRPGRIQSSSNRLIFGICRRNTNVTQKSLGSCYYPPRCSLLLVFCCRFSGEKTSNHVFANQQSRRTQFYQRHTCDFLRRHVTLRRCGTNSRLEARNQMVCDVFSHICSSLRPCVIACNHWSDSMSC